LIVDKLPELVRLQTEAIKNIKIDKLTVWDGGTGASGDGKTSTYNFISGLYKSVPPLQEIFNMAGMELPDYLKGKTAEELRNMADEAKAKLGEGKEKDDRKK
jgi:flotillin